MPIAAARPDLEMFSVFLDLVSSFISLMIGKTPAAQSNAEHITSVPAWGGFCQSRRITYSIFGRRGCRKTAPYLYIA